MKVRATWEFDVDDTWGETKEQCIEIAKAEFEQDVFSNLEWEVVDDNPYPYETVLVINGQ